MRKIITFADCNENEMKEVPRTRSNADLKRPATQSEYS
jgi:hypothetical protein